MKSYLDMNPFLILSETYCHILLLFDALKIAPFQIIVSRRWPYTTVRHLLLSSEHEKREVTCYKSIMWLISRYTTVEVGYTSLRLETVTALSYWQFSLDESEIEIVLGYFIR